MALQDLSSYTQLSTERASIFLSIFQVVGEQLIDAIVHHIFPNHNEEKGRMKTCFSDLLNLKPLFYFRSNYHMKNATVVIKTAHAPLSLIRTAGVSSSVPAYAWVSPAIVCLHNKYHKTQLQSYSATFTRLPGTWSSETPQPGKLMVFMEVSNSVFFQIMHSESRQFGKLMKKIWISILGGNGLCYSYDVCDIDKKFSLVDLNQLDKSDVPMLVCDKFACARHPNFKAANMNARNLSPQRFLQLNGWSYKSAEHIANSRDTFDWYRFFWERFHLKWFFFNYKQSGRQRAQIFTKQRQNDDERVLKYVNISLVICLCLFNCAFLLSFWYGK